MRRRPRQFRLLHLAAAATAFALSVSATLSWAWTGGIQQLGLPPGAQSSVRDPGAAQAEALAEPGPGDDPTVRLPGASTAPSAAGSPSPSSSAAAPDSAPADSASAGPAPATAALGGPRPAARGQTCRTGVKLVPTCGALWGVAPGAFTDRRGAPALADFEKLTGRRQDIYHAYHRGTGQLFPTKAEIAIAREPGAPRLLFLNWKPRDASWAEIAAGDPKVDAFLDRLAAHIKREFPERFFLTVHHEPENDVRAKAGSGYTADDYAAMFRHVVRRLRAHGADNVVTVLVHMAYVPHTTKPWFGDLYPGDDVVDWIGFDTYAYSDPGYGHGDFAEMLDRRMSSKPGWPGFYSWAVRRHPGKPLMVSEWGVWGSARNPGHKADFYRMVARQIADFPNIRAMVYFDTPHDQRGRDSTVDATRNALAAYRKLGDLPIFGVRIDN
ncbi:glycoside hydrolase family 26 protein [Mangrovihabitans endophyticus]|uniref:GH26 domain-containing protein n=1 Tax=Mangrovihabitans endophyticus TaxID=1751298 RepID=A0A8J3FNH6_9ACTN|nr:glycosyl hydrolase [Mangrovihabitans endophyticus]GGK91907.1 hypothetical protein GCM10012284_27240 [Mangrovihabitans endophyticus]